MRLKIRNYLLIVLALLVPLKLLWAWGGSDLRFPEPAPVVDEYGLLNASEQKDLTLRLQKIKNTNGIEISVYIPASLKGHDINEFSIAVVEAWKLGRKKEDKGLLLLVAPKERKMRFEVGYGLEGDLTDAFTKRILDNIMRPYFRQGEFYSGILYSIQALQDKIPISLDDVPEGRTGDKSGPIPPIFFIFIVVLVITIRLLGLGGYSRRGPGIYTRGPWSGGSGGGGSWGGGGGGFGGGGSSSSW